MHQHERQRERGWNSQSLQQGNDRRGVLYPKVPMSILLVALFLVCVHMSVSNIRHSVKILLDTDVNDGYTTRMEKIAHDEMPQMFPYSPKAPILSGRNNKHINNDENRNEKNDNKMQKMTSKIKVNETELFMDNLTDNSTSTKSHKKSGSIAFVSKYKSVLEEKATSLNSSKYLSHSQLLSVIPNADNTVISLISMGRLGNTFYAERCIRSIRRRGLFSGIIMVFTDSTGYKRYQQTIPSWDDRTIIIQGREEDMNPRKENKGDPGNNHSEPELIKYRQDTMIFKRFKTHHSKYITEYSALSDSIRYVMYADVDNIIGNRLDIFFEDYTKMVKDEYQRAIDFHRNATSTTGDGVAESATESDTSDQGGFSFVSMFQDKHLRSKMHSGIIIFDLLFEERCVNGWRNEIDTFWDLSDQAMFLRVLNNYDRYRCTVFRLPKKFMSFATKGLMRDGMDAQQGRRGKRKPPLQYPTFIHVTNYRVRRLNNATVHNEFLRHVLELKDDEMMTDTIRWEEVLSHIAN